MAKLVEELVVRKSVRVQLPVERAFALFVEQMETWWPPEHQIGDTPFEVLVVEPRVGGRWYERDRDGRECSWGNVVAWDPPRKVTLSWHLGPDWKFNPDPAAASDVEIRFTPDGPGATVVELEHTRLERHGAGFEQMRAMLDSPRAWGYTLGEFARVANGEVKA